MKGKLAFLGWAMSLSFIAWVLKPAYESRIHRAICNARGHGRADFIRLPDGFTRMVCQRCGDYVDLRIQVVSAEELLQANSLFDIPARKTTRADLLN